MADDAAPSGSTVKAGGDDPEPTIEINIKTLDSQVHKLRVQKNETVLNLKEKIVDAAGIPVDQQRLIFRGRVLKDDHLLSEYHLEDGYTLHLVARRTAEGQHSSGTSEEGTHGNVNVAANGGMLGDMSRTVRDILGSLGLEMPGGVVNGAFSVPLTTAPEGASNVGRTQPGNPAQPGFSIHVSQLQPGGAIPRNMVIPDSMATIVEYINRMDLLLQNNGVPSVESIARPPSSEDAYLNGRFPSPDVLVSVIERTQQLLGGSASSALSHLAHRIQRDAATSDTAIRSQIQNESAQLGAAMQHLGAMLLELGRTMMMLRMGASPDNAFVNAGSAIYINPAGPNPIMVQPSFQSAPHFGVSSIPVLSGVSGQFGIVDPSRTSGVNVYGGASATNGTSVGSTTASATTVDGARQNVERTQGGNSSANSTPGLPTRTVVAAIPARSSADAPNHVLGVILPVQVRSQVAAPNQSTVSQGSQAAVGNGSQPNATFVVPQASSGGVANISSIVAQITAQVANAMAANQPGQVSSSVQNAADQGAHPTTNNGDGTVSSEASRNMQLQNEILSSQQAETPLNVQSHVTATGTLQSNTSDPNLSAQASSTANVFFSVDSTQEQSQMEGINVDSSRSYSEELAAALAGQDILVEHARDIPLSAAAENSELKNKPSDGVTGESVKPSASGRSEPLGLGGGLQPKRRSKISKPSGTSGDSSEPLNTSSVPRSQEAVSAGQQILQALASSNADVRNGSVADTRPPSSMPQFAGGMPPRRPGGEGQLDIGSMLSSVLNSPVFGNLMSNVAAQTGLESPADVRNIMEDLTQNPAMMDTISNIVQNADGPRRGQGGGFDLSRMMQQMMPVVSQVLGGAAARPAGTDGGESGLQPGRRAQIDLHQARERIEQHESPEDIFGAVLETAAQAYGEDETIQVMLEELASDPELADDYLKLLIEQVGERVQSESETEKQP
ncbi:large proline-rich protein bag6-B isoform X2 [Brachypodium distachyon]|uniref:Ubiquitin-like domain-containing protein n=1 Tax=Brachypodium distachyon TaxID=15368 RepID=A0A0Q3L056_BRADI|nr:large proline-rich protein bag6-B isoform X2 [Brachypodium distachyon]KQK16729.1 hypothetical protein BRADI_1g30247v3 [Brachypodium distachyon]|eukprot:XP_003563277.1 large proline-rich protein bag6-B isoform X2 [Brachypodium distachyon]